MVITRMENHRIMEETVETVFDSEYDVIVVGLGTAGSIAAITAGEKGLHVLGIESLNCMGGISTAGGILSYYYGGKGGRFEKIDDRILNPESSGFSKTHGLNPELRKMELEQTALAAGVTIQYEATVIGVYKIGQHVIGLKYKSREGITSVSATYIIDATGDATICRLSGCMVKWGRETDYGVQPYSNCILTMANGEIRSRSTDCGYIDQSDERSINKEILHSSTLSLHLRDSYASGERILRMEQQLGIREGAYIIGEENVTFEDFIAEKRYDHPVFYAYANLDNHRKDITLESDIQQEWIFAGGLWGLLMAVPIPLGALIPKGFEGIVAVGRCIAVDHDMSSFTRMMRDCQKSGEVAAEAVYLAIQNQISINNISYDELSQKLRKTGCLNLQYQGRMGMMKVDGKGEGKEYLHWDTDLCHIKTELDTNRAGFAIYSLYRMGDSVIPTVKQWMQHDVSENVKRNAAIALALLKDESCIPVLREIVISRDVTITKTSDIYNQMREVTAIYFLGAFGDSFIVPKLLRIIRDKNYCSDLKVDFDEMIPSLEDAYFQLFSASLIALMKIGMQKEELYQDIKKSIWDVLNQKDFSLITTLKPTKSLHFDMKPIILNFVKKKGYE